MRGPKHAGSYPDRNIDCQEAVAEGIADLVENASVNSMSEADFTKKLASAPSAGTQTLIEEAIAAGWPKEETVEAIKTVATGMNIGYTGTDLNE